MFMRLTSTPPLTASMWNLTSRSAMHKPSNQDEKQEALRGNRKGQEFK